MCQRLSTRSSGPDDERLVHQCGETANTDAFEHADLGTDHEEAFGQPGPVILATFVADIDPGSVGFDAAVEFAPDWRRVRASGPSQLRRLAARIGLQARGYRDNRFSDYNALVAAMLAKSEPRYRRFRCVTPGFDNSPRRRTDALIIGDSTPAARAAMPGR